MATFGSQVGHMSWRCSCKYSPAKPHWPRTRFVRRRPRGRRQRHPFPHSRDRGFLRRQRGHVNAAEIPNIIKTVRQALSQSDAPVSEAADETPKADKRAIKKSITDDALISFVDNKPYKTLKRHLARHGMDMNQYRERYGLPKDYPSVAPSYSAARSEMAKSLGLGARGRGAKAAAPAPAAASKRAPRKAPAPAAADADS